MPPIIQELEIGYHQKEDTDIMTEAIFTSEKVKEFSFCDRWCIGTYFLTIFSGLAKYFFVCDRPGNTRHRNGNEKQMNYLG